MRPARGASPCAPAATASSAGAHAAGDPSARGASAAPAPCARGRSRCAGAHAAGDHAVSCGASSRRCAAGRPALTPAPETGQLWCLCWASLASGVSAVSASSAGWRSRRRPRRRWPVVTGAWSVSWTGSDAGRRAPPRPAPRRSSRTRPHRCRCSPRLGRRSRTSPGLSTTCPTSHGSRTPGWRQQSETASLGARPSSLSAARRLSPGSVPATAATPSSHNWPCRGGSTSLASRPTMPAPSASCSRTPRPRSSWRSECRRTRAPGCCNTRLECSQPRVGRCSCSRTRCCWPRSWAPPFLARVRSESPRPRWSVRGRGARRPPRCRAARPRRQGAARTSSRGACTRSRPRSSTR
mmetsp:Transcript_2598/g.6818  ORF Transcript_2598/g.6818 Transcript_2598/m.6818 type:complete len:353 (+) Transcript_2598:3-1061(+)